MLGRLISREEENDEWGSGLCECGMKYETRQPFNSASQ